MQWKHCGWRVDMCVVALHFTSPLALGPWHVPLGPWQHKWSAGAHAFREGAPTKYAVVGSNGDMQAGRAARQLRARFDTAPEGYEPPPLPPLKAGSLPAAAADDDAGDDADDDADDHAPAVSASSSSLRRHEVDGEPEVAVPPPQAEEAEAEAEASHSIGTTVAASPSPSAQDLELDLILGGGSTAEEVGSAEWAVQGQGVAGILSEQGEFMGSPSSGPRGVLHQEESLRRRLANQELILGESRAAAEVEGLDNSGAAAGERSRSLGGPPAQQSSTDVQLAEASAGSVLRVRPEPEPIDLILGGGSTAEEVGSAGWAVQGQGVAEILSEQGEFMGSPSSGPRGVHQQQQSLRSGQARPSSDDPGRGDRPDPSTGAAMAGTGELRYAGAAMAGGTADGGGDTSEANSLSHLVPRPATPPGRPPSRRARIGAAAAAAAAAPAPSDEVAAMIAAAAAARTTTWTTPAAGAVITPDQLDDHRSNITALHEASALEGGAVLMTITAAAPATDPGGQAPESGLSGGGGVRGGSDAASSPPTPQHKIDYRKRGESGVPRRKAGGSSSSACDIICCATRPH
jgi:hypothetical protein